MQKDYKQQFYVLLDELSIDIDSRKEIADFLEPHIITEKNMYFSDVDIEFNDLMNSDKDIQKKTRKDVEYLKNDWFNDPCYDLEDEEGFEEYREELIEFKIKCEKKWKRIQLIKDGYNLENIYTNQLLKSIKWDVANEMVLVEDIDGNIFRTLCKDIRRVSQ